MQAFWVRTSASSNLCFEDAIRLTDPNAATNDFYKSNSQNESLIRLEINGQGFQFTYHGNELVDVKLQK